MSRVCRLAVGSALAVAVATALVAFAEPAAAQPGQEKGKGKGKGKDFEKGFEKKAEPGRDEVVRALEAELTKMKTMQEEIEAKLKQLKAAQQPNPPTGPGGFGPGGGRGFSGPGGGFGFGPGGGFGFDRGGPGGARGPGGMGPGGNPPVEGIVRAASGMSPEQLRELIGALDKLRAEKERASAPAPRPKEGPGRPDSRPGAGGPSQEDILRKLDQLSREIEEIRRAVRH